MKKIFKKFVVFILRLEAKLVLTRFKPLVIGITGTVGKTSAKEAVYAVLAPRFKARKSEKSYNSEIGLPLTVLGLENAGNSFFGWLKNLILGFYAALFSFDYPKILILEYGLDRPGDIKNLVKLARPNIGIFTASSDVPVHVEFFENPEKIIQEKGELIKSLPRGGFAVLNYDDAAVLNFQNQTKAKVLTYGFNDGADIKASEYKLIFNRESPEGVAFKVDYRGASMPVRIWEGFGRPQVYSSLAGIAAGIAMGLNVVEITNALGNYKPPAGRLKLIKGIKDSWIIDDSYNSSPIAVYEALSLLNDLPFKRKIAVLGDMLELGSYAERVHREAGERASKIANIIFTFGRNAKFIAESAKNKGFDPDRLFSYLNQEELIKELIRRIQAGDLILVKGSQGMRMEKIVKAIMANPEKAKDLLVRQDWKDN